MKTLDKNIACKTGEIGGRIEQMTIEEKCDVLWDWNTFSNNREVYCKAYNLRKYLYDTALWFKGQYDGFYIDLKDEMYLTEDNNLALRTPQPKQREIIEDKREGRPQGRPVYLKVDHKVDPSKSGRLLASVDQINWKFFRQLGAKMPAQVVFSGKISKKAFLEVNKAGYNNSEFIRMLVCLWLEKRK